MSEDRLKKQQGFPIGHFPFGINNAKLVDELRKLADSIERGEAYPQRVDRNQQDIVEDFRMFTLAVTFAAPATSENGDRS